MTDLHDHLHGLLAETKFCSCGRELVVVTETIRPRDTATGERIVGHYKECPRFRRGWFNAWLGGWSHDSHDMDHPLLERRWQ